MVSHSGLPPKHRNVRKVENPSSRGFRWTQGNMIIGGERWGFVTRELGLSLASAVCPSAGFWAFLNLHLLGLMLAGLRRVFPLGGAVRLGGE